MGSAQPRFRVMDVRRLTRAAIGLVVAVACVAAIVILFLRQSNETGAQRHTDSVVRQQVIRISASCPRDHPTVEGCRALLERLIKYASPRERAELARLVGTRAHSGAPARLQPIPPPVLPTRSGPIAPPARHQVSAPRRPKPQPASPSASPASPPPAPAPSPVPSPPPVPPVTVPPLPVPQLPCVLQVRPLC